ncbi:transmembrane protein, putative (macronuclear) [Tetrahymena thermophila SB210]|uniref:Transmembrane protein, putative n=1 Tax=Tetrahymena thermophila (strain SB210) TaxID=312017 RepID=W7XIF8_TETTS|nr:transmembrane protein, putative [Tetrahymena thermophila SB210]EWS74606.1 transmembrane protein, putative [Tetrahymena thermophila SB210]|eukprot:XP_012652828.1 transmembrane protein, putative [Tetrahymena thermophila SB210]
MIQCAINEVTTKINRIMLNPVINSAQNVNKTLKSQKNILLNRSILEALKLITQNIQRFIQLITIQIQIPQYVLIHQINKSSFILIYMKIHFTKKHPESFIKVSQNVFDVALCDSMIYKLTSLFNIITLFFTMLFQQYITSFKFCKHNIQPYIFFNFFLGMNIFIENRYLNIFSFYKRFLLAFLWHLILSLFILILFALIFLFFTQRLIFREQVNWLIRLRLV